MLVSAMFAPKSSEHAQLHRVGLPVQPVQDHVVFGPGKGYLIQLLLSNCHRGCSAFRSDTSGVI